jgi:hypothetical protein
MMRIVIAAASLAAIAGAAPAFAEGTYHIRNASQTRLMCALRRQRGSAFYRFTLLPGRAFRQTVGTDGERVLTCSSSLYRRTVFRIRAGRSYDLIETGTGALRLRSVPAPGAEDGAGL